MSTVIEKATILAELEEIQQLGDGLIRPSAVVEYARDPNTLLHSRFTWDDTEAAEQWRLEQARKIIRVHVKMTMPDKLDVVSVRAYVSLPSDRKSGRGYRSLATVMDHADLRAELLDTAKRELRAFRRKYKTLTELAEVHSAIDRIVGPDG